MKRTYEILAPKNNGGLLRRLILVIPEKKVIISR